MSLAPGEIGRITVLGLAVVERAQHQPVDRRAGTADAFRVAQHDDRRNDRLEPQIRKSFRLARRAKGGSKRVRHRIGQRQAVAGEVDGAGADTVAAAEAQRRQACADDGEFGRHLERSCRRIFGIEVRIVRIIGRHGLGRIGIAREMLADRRDTETPSGPAGNRFLEIEIADLRRVRAGGATGHRKLGEAFLVLARKALIPDLVERVAPMQRMPGIGVRIPHVEAESTHQILGEIGARLRMLGCERIVERLRLLKALEQGERAAVTHQREPGRAQRWQGRGRIEHLRVQRRRHIGDALGDNDRLVHGAVDVDLGKPEIARIEIEQTDDFAARVRRAQAAAWCGHEQMVAAEVEIVIGGHCRWHGLGIERPRPARRHARHAKGVESARGGERQEVVRQLEIEHQSKRAQQRRIGLQGADRLVEVDHAVGIGRLEGLRLWLVMI